MPFGWIFEWWYGNPAMEGRLRPEVNRIRAEYAAREGRLAQSFRDVQLTGKRESLRTATGLATLSVNFTASAGSFVRPSSSVSAPGFNAAGEATTRNSTFNLARPQGAANSGGRGLIGIVKPGGTLDDALRAHYVEIARSAQMAAAVRRYNRIATFLRQKPCASVDDIVKALGEDVTFSRIGHLRSGVFLPGQHSGRTSYWLQGNPTTTYGRRIGRHELTHLGAALRGQDDRILHEVAVQAATTPENLVTLTAGSIVVIGSSVYWVSAQ
jgi:hypothetical protein